MSKVFPFAEISARLPGRRRLLWASGVGVVVLGLLLWWLAPLGEKPPSGTIVFSTGGTRGCTRSTAAACATSWRRTCLA